MKNLFVGNLNFQTTETDLGELFKTFGQVTRVHVAVDRETGRARGFAFIEMPNDDEAAKAIAGLDGKDLAFESNTAIARRTRSSSSAMRMPIRISVGAMNRAICFVVRFVVGPQTVDVTSVIPRRGRPAHPSSSSKRERFFFETFSSLPAH